MSDDTWDEAYISSAFVSWHTTPSEDGSYIPMTEEEASRVFNEWLNAQLADAWDSGVESEADEHGHRHLPESANPYRKGNQ